MMPTIQADIAKFDQAAASRRVFCMVHMSGTTVSEPNNRIGVCPTAIHQRKRAWLESATGVLDS